MCYVDVYKMNRISYFIINFYLVEIFFFIFCCSVMRFFGAGDLVVRVYRDLVNRVVVIVKLLV